MSALGHRVNIKVQGINSEFDAICLRLGLSGPDDFAIPEEAWEARKSRKIRISVGEVIHVHTLLNFYSVLYLMAIVVN